MTAEIANGWAPILTGIELRSGSKGVFKIEVDGEVVYDKSSTRRFPSAGEVAKSVEKLLGEKLDWRQRDH